MLSEKEMLLVEIIKEATKNDIFIQTVNDKYSTGLLSVRAHGFSKSGTAEIYILNDQITVETRYNETTVIESFEDLGQIAFDWWVRYKDRSPFEKPDSYWARYFVKMGWVKEKSETVVSYEL